MNEKSNIGLVDQTCQCFIPTISQKNQEN